MSDDESVNSTRGERHGHLHNTVEGASSESGSEKKKLSSKGGGNKSKTSYNRSDIGIEELKGYIFTYGTQNQQNNYIRTKKALADYVGVTFKFAKQLYKSINGGKEVELVEPEKPSSAKPTQIEVKRYEVLCNRHFAKVEEYERERTKLFRLIMGQCSPTLRDKLESMPEFPGLEDTDNFIGLLGLIHDLVYSTDSGQYQYWKMQAAMTKLLGMKQESKEPIMSFAERFLTQVEATESLWGPLCPTISKLEHAVFEDVEGEDEATRAQRLEQWVKDLQERVKTQAESDTKAREKFLACLFLGSTDRERYKEVIDDLANDYGLGNINYPEDVSSMLNLLTNRRGLKTNRAKQLEDIQDGVLTSFQQNHPNMRCNYCRGRGHMSDTCYKRLEDEERKANNSNRSSRSSGSSQGWFSENPRSGVNSFQHMERSAWDPEY
jgi:hypothetical protein